ncbi:hypothetical protein [Orenia marismortui]|uniref:Type IV pilus assembly protein PilO n=1 Tax=Orenia marismortui TaxID=46469 RepID=A0A4R8HB33_9FIRM|nr:hypothetical protein [Orenia marismortui]TDX53275.1 hypothetical protein C7959_103128 [Orenia marismortui]
MQLNKRERRMLIIALIIIGGGSLLKWILIPIWNDYQSIDTKLSLTENKLKKGRFILRDAEKYNNKLKSIKGELAALNKTYFHGQKAKIKLQVLKIIDQYLKESSLKIKDKSVNLEGLTKYDLSYSELSPEEKTIIKELSMINYKLKLEGSLKNLILFLSKLTENEKLLSVDYLDINADAKESQLSIELTIKAINREGEINE